MTTTAHTRPSLFIDGKWRAPHDQGMTAVISPSTEQTFGYAPTGSPTDVDVAVESARRALRSSPWARATGAERATAMRAIADELEARAQSTAATVTGENGMPLSLAQIAEGRGPSATLRYYADLAETTPVEERRAPVGRRGVTVVRRDPIGVVAAVVPWNFPQSLTMFKVAPALAAGCTVVLKPAPETSLDAFALADAAQASGLPPGVINIVTGGRDVGAWLVGHPGVDKVAFTGSTAAGRAIGEVCGRLLRPVTLELGGKSAAIILDDADLTQVARGLSWSSLLNSGQTCYLSTRILAPQQRYAEVVEAVADVASSLRVGDPYDLSTQMGPLVTRAQRDRVEDYLARGRAEGARVATGGSRPADLTTGWYMEPTVLADLPRESTTAHEEIFGPVLVVQPYSDVEDAIAIANDSEYGLGGTVWTTDVERGLDVARRVETGSIGVNFFDLDIGAPFGGVKASGLGRELGPEGLSAYVSLKSIYLRD